MLGGVRSGALPKCQERLFVPALVREKDGSVERRNARRRQLLRDGGHRKQYGEQE
jgi:hypothetical protein